MPGASVAVTLGRRVAAHPRELPGRARGGLGAGGHDRAEAAARSWRWRSLGRPVLTRRAERLAAAAGPPLTLDGDDRRRDPHAVGAPRLRVRHRARRQGRGPRADRPPRHHGRDRRHRGPLRRSPAAPCCSSSPRRRARGLERAVRRRRPPASGETRAATLVTLFAAISAYGALNGWILLQGELPCAMARDGVFPKVFARESRRGTPVFALVSTSGLVTPARARELPVEAWSRSSPS